jgi:hypothetical protein
MLKFIIHFIILIFNSYDLNKLFFLKKYNRKIILTKMFEIDWQYYLIQLVTYAGMIKIHF